MALVSWCPQCPSPVAFDATGYACDTHGSVTPLWRSALADYRSFTEVLGVAAGMPTYVPWPLSPGWTIADFGCVGLEGTSPLATVTTTMGAGELDGDIEVTIVAEEPGVGLGARCAGFDRADPGGTVGIGPAAVRVRVDSRPVSMWSVPSGSDDAALARSVFAGEADGRWLWLVMRPASAALLLREEWLLSDAGGFGPGAVELPFGGSSSGW